MSWRGILIVDGDWFDVCTRMIRGRGCRDKDRECSVDGGSDELLPNMRGVLTLAGAMVAKQQLDEAQ